MIEHGERVLLLGPSGSGKSTLLAAMAGLLARSGAGEAEGTLQLDGTAGVVFQDPESQLVLARAGDDVAFGLENTGIPASEIWSRVDTALSAVGFPYGRDRSTAALSGGEKQRLAIAGALALRPNVLLLDEPTANLDPLGAQLVRGALRRVLANRTCVMVEHRIAEALDLIDRVVVIAAGGGVIADGTPERVFREQGTALAAAGIWVPGPPPVAPPRRGAPSNAIVVEARDLTFAYPGSTVSALAGVSVILRSGRTVALVGANGSGKSTLALLIGGLLRPSRGAVRDAGGADLARLRARALILRVGSVFQDPEHQFVTGRVVDELTIGPLRAGRAPLEARRLANDLLERMGLAALGAANPFTLSGGEKRRLSVATALATAPGALILDEPTFAQDRRTYGEILALLADFRDRGGALCFASHDPFLVDALADERLTLLAGRTQ